MTSYFIVFTDILDYTHLSRESGNKLPELLKSYKETLRNCVENHAGRLVSAQADKSLSLYETAHSAIAAAIEIQGGICSISEIPLRIGIHQGEVQFVEDELIGDALNTALRICSMAIQGCILVSEQVYEQISGDVDFSFRRLGVFKLKHTAQPLMLYSAGKVGAELPGRNRFKDDERIADNSIAVLPFRDLSPEQDQEYLGQGFSEEIINNLSQLEGLKVTARTSSFAIAKKNLEIREIGEALGVSHILEGSVRKAGEHLRVSTQMINARDGFNEFSHSFNSTFEDIFNIQEELSVKIVEKLREQFDIGPDRKKFQESKNWNPEVYDLLLRGRYELNQGTAESMEKAVNTFKSITRMEPDFAPAYAWLARTHLTQTVLRYVDQGVGYAMADAAVAKAMEINPEQPGNKTAMLIVEFWKGGWNLPKFHQVIAEMLQVYPGSSELRMFYAMYFFMLGDLDKALMEIKLAYELDPYSEEIKVRLMRIRFSREEYEVTLKLLDELIGADPSNPIRRFQKAWVLAFSGRIQEALEAISTFPEIQAFQPYKLSALVYLFAKQGKPEKAFQQLELLQEMIRKEEVYSPNFHLAIAYTGLKNKEQALVHLEQGLKDREYDFLFVNSEPMWKDYRHDERFIKICRKAFQGEAEGKFVTIQTDTHEVLEINTGNLYYIAAEDNYSRVFWMENEEMKERLLRITLKNLETQLDDPDIIRCHRSYMVNIARKFEIRGDASGYSLASAALPEEIPISRSKGKEIISMLKARHS